MKTFIWYFLALSLGVTVLQSCDKEDLCYYAGHPDDISIDARFLSMTDDGRQLIELDVIYDKMPTADIIYKLVVNGKTSNAKTITLIDDGPAVGFVKITSATSTCFLYKEINEVYDFSDACDYLGGEDYMEISEEEVITASEEPNSILLKTDFKGPANMDLLYEWTIGNQTGSGESFQVFGNGLMSGTLKVINPIDNCSMTKGIMVDLS